MATSEPLASVAASSPPAQASGQGATALISIEDAIEQALPLPDVAFGGAVLVIIIMFHAFWIRLITGSFLKRIQRMGARNALWRADFLFVAMVACMLALHLSEVVIWSAALVLNGAISDWALAAYFAANCYTALGEPFRLPHDWRMVPPIIAMSGIFAFAWTASLLVDFVDRYNSVRAAIIARQHPLRDGEPTPPPVRASKHRRDE